jgi:hypothetical protein
VVFNLCDGDEINGSPGIPVIRYLNEKGLTYTGADEASSTSRRSDRHEASFDARAFPPSLGGHSTDAPTAPASPAF